MNYNKKNLNRFKVEHSVYGDLNFCNSQFKKILIECSVLFLGMIFCAFKSFFVYIELAMFFLFIILNNNSAKVVYFCVFLVPFTLIFKTENFYFNDSSRFVYLFVFVVYIVKFLRDVANKKIKLNLKNIVLLLLITIYLTQPWKIELFIRNIELFVCIILFYLVCCYKSELDAREIICIFIFALMGSCFIGLFQPISERMNEILPYYYTENGLQRFHGCGATNILALELVIGISLIIYLQLNRKLSITSPLFVFPMVLALLETYSKLGLLLLIILIALYIMFYYRCRKENDVAFLLTIYSIIFALMVKSNQIQEILNRMFFSFDENERDLVIKSALICSATLTLSFKNVNIRSDFEKSIIDGVTTGRFEIWKHYILDLFSSPFVLIFGHGAYLSNLKWGEFTDYGITPHNMYIFFLNQYGILLYFVVGIIFLKIIFRKEFKFNIFAIVPLSMFLLGMLSEDFLYYEMFVMMLIMCFVICYNKKNKKGEIYDT